MQCKYCQKEMEDDVTVCPHCGESQEQSEVSKKLRTVTIMLSVLVGAVLLALLAGVVHYGVTGSFLPRKNGLQYRNNYTTSAEKLDTDSGYKSYEKKLDKVVATMGEHKLSNRLLQIYYWKLVNNASYTDLDKTKQLHEQYQDPLTKTTWEQFFIQEAILAWQQDMLLADAAKAAGFQMPESYRKNFETLETDLANAALSSGCADSQAYLSKYLGRGVDFQTYYDYLWNYYYGALYWTEYAMGIEVTDAQIDAYFQEHETEMASGYFGIPITKESGKLVDVRHILVQITGGTKDEEGNTVYSEEEWTACQEKAQAILDQWLAGEQTEESFGKLASEKTEDPGSKASGGLYEYVYKGQMVEPFEKWCFDETRKEGDTGLVKTSYGYHVMYYIYGEEGWIRMSRDGAKVTAASVTLEEMIAANTMQINYKNIALGEME